MTMPNSEDLRVRLEGDLKERLDQVLDAKRTSQQRAVNELVGWFVRQDPLVQSAILGQIEIDSPAMGKLIHDRLVQATSNSKTSRGLTLRRTAAKAASPKTSRGQRPKG